MSRREKRLTVEIQARPSRGGLHLLVDSTGIKMLGEGDPKTKKHGAEYRRHWRKVHPGIDAETLEIEVPDNSVGDAPMLPELLGQIPTEEAVLSVSGDGAYDTQDCHDAIAERGAEAVIPTRKNAQQKRLAKAKRPGAAARNEILRTTNWLGRGIWKKWNGYHQRSLVETKCAASSCWASG